MTGKSRKPIWDIPGRESYDAVFGGDGAESAYSALLSAANLGLIEDGRTGPWVSIMKAASRRWPHTEHACAQGIRRAGLLVGILLCDPDIRPDVPDFPDDMRMSPATPPSDDVDVDSRVRTFISNGLDWLLSMLPAFIERADDLGLVEYIGRMDESFATVATRSSMLSLAMIHMHDMGADDIDMRGDPRGYGDALATAWCDLHVHGITLDEAYVFPSVDWVERWRRATAPRSSRSVRIPACAASTSSLAWLEGMRLRTADHPFDSGPLGSYSSMIAFNDSLCIDWRSAAERGYAPSIVRALESDGTRDYSVVRSWARVHGCVRSVMDCGTDEILRMLDSCDSPATTLGVLDACDVLALAAGGDPSCPEGPHPYLPDSVIPESADGWIHDVAYTRPVVDTALDLLERGMPADMVAENPALHRRDRRYDDSDEGDA